MMFHVLSVSAMIMGVSAHVFHPFHIHSEFLEVTFSSGSSTDAGTDANVADPSKKDEGTEAATGGVKVGVVVRIAYDESVSCGDL